MTKQTVRVLWILIGLCLSAGVIAGIVLLLGPPDRPWREAVRELSTLVDVLALLFWMGIFAIYLARRRTRK